MEKQCCLAIRLAVSRNSLVKECLSRFWCVFDIFCAEVCVDN